MAMTMLAKSILIAGMVVPLSAQTGAEQTGSEQVAAHARAAQQAERRNDFHTAVFEYGKVAKLLPQSVEMQSNLGVALYFDHDLARSIAVFRRAITLNPKLFTPHLFSGLASYRLSNPDAAVPELEKARINPSDAVAHTWLGYAYIAQFRYDEAAKEFETACRLAPDNANGWYEPIACSETRSEAQRLSWGNHRTYPLCVYHQGQLERLLSSRKRISGSRRERADEPCA